MISDTVFKLCHEEATVSSEMAKTPTAAPGSIYTKLFGHYDTAGAAKSDAKHYEPASEEALRKAEQCGHWGPTKPSETFLRLYHDALGTLDKSVEGAVCSPPLLGSCGVMPLTIMSTVPDIMRHMSNLIVRAEKEVIIATNYWISSVASTFVTNALKELSKRAGARQSRVVVKLLYDRGSIKQVLDNHQNVPEKEYTDKAVNLPKASEIPNIDLQVMNYHRPLLGTFHAKFMIADRKFALAQSNNIQDNANFEMACHLEGPIVDSFYDMALISWAKELVPPLPAINSPAAAGGVSAFDNPAHHNLLDTFGRLIGSDVILHPQKLLNLKAYGHDAKPGLGPTTHAALTHPVAGGGEGSLTPKKEKESTLQDPRLVANPVGNAERGADLATETYLASGTSVLPQAQIERPSKDNALPEHTTEDPHYDTDIAGEVARVQSAVSPRQGETRVQAVARHLNHTVNPGFQATAPDCPPSEEYTPYIPHPVHNPFPIAMVNRYPYGTPLNDAIYVPQNEVWLSALRNAKKNVFIQSPNLNAAALLPSILDTCRRGIDVFCYICLGYNDSGELLPAQGGTNEMIAHKLYAELDDQHKKNLHWYWYVAKDQVEPIVASKKKRDCHIKLMIVDEHIGIQGSGNQDTQSWCHSQEINIMFDSRDVCASWIDGLRRNQSTHMYGKVSNVDGIWRDKDGNQAKDVIGIDPGKFSWAKGIVGAIQRVQGTGDF